MLIEVKNTPYRVVGLALATGAMAFFERTIHDRYRRRTGIVDEFHKDPRVSKKPFEPFEVPTLGLSFTSSIQAGRDR